MLSNMSNFKINGVIVLIFVITLSCMFLPSALLSQFITFVNLFIPISVFVMFIMNNMFQGKKYVTK